MVVYRVSWTFSQESSGLCSGWVGGSYGTLSSSLSELTSPPKEKLFDSKEKADAFVADLNKAAVTLSLGLQFNTFTTEEVVN